MDKYVSQQNTEGNNGNYSYIHLIIFSNPDQGCSGSGAYPKNTGVQSMKILWMGHQSNKGTIHEHTFALRYHNVNAQFV